MNFKKLGKKKIIFLLLFVLSCFLIAVTFISSFNNPKQTLTLGKNVLPNNTIQGVKNNIQKDTANIVSFKVTKVIDGDTIEIEGGQRIRYIGMDTPETVDPRKPVQCFGREASNKNKELVEGKDIRLEKDVSETDKYGRLLRYIYLPAADSNSGDLFVNEYLIKEGYAHASSYPPDIKYQEQFSAAERDAQENTRGLWNACSANSLENSSSFQPQQSDCKIKGNISSSGEKIYHMPGQYYYEKTVIDTSRGEKWFCTEDEAQTVGWRKAKK